VGGGGGGGGRGCEGVRVRGWKGVNSELAQYIQFTKK